MEKDVVISIRGMQWYENRESDSIELVTRGVMLRDGVVCTLSYTLLYGFSFKSLS